MIVLVIRLSRRNLRNFMSVFVFVIGGDGVSCGG